LPFYKPYISDIPDRMYRSGIFFTFFLLVTAQSWAGQTVYQRDIPPLLYFKSCLKDQNLGLNGSGSDKTAYPSVKSVDQNSIENALISGSAIYYPHDFTDIETITRMLSLEADARDKRKGCWKNGRYNVFSSKPDLDTGEFMIVQGRVRKTGESYENIFLNFGNDWKTDFTVRIQKNNRALKDFDPDLFQGHNVRVRGFVEYYNGPSITLAHPALLEIQAE